MFLRRKKVEVEARRPRNRFLRLFRTDAFQGSLVSLESTDREDTYNKNPLTIKSAMLEAEYQNAKALLAFQKNERFH